MESNASLVFGFISTWTGLEQALFYELSPRLRRGDGGGFTADHAEHAEGMIWVCVLLLLPLLLLLLILILIFPVAAGASAGMGRGYFAQRRGARGEGFHLNTPRLSGSARE